MTLTARGREDLEAYLARVEASLEGRRDVDAREVVAGIREHVEAELAARGAAPATAEDVADILEALGSPSAIASAGGENATEPAAVISTGTAAAILLMALAGIALVPTRSALAGWALLLASLLGARLALPSTGTPGNAPGRLVRLLWQLGAGVAALAILCAPAVLVWASAQIGGLLEGFLVARTGDAGPPRSGSYWLATSAVAAGVTGVVWIVGGLALSRVGGLVRAGLGPATRVVPIRRGRALLLAGGVLVAAAVVLTLVT